MIELSNGCKFEWLAASGALGFDGQGWIHERLMRAVRLIELPQELVRVSKTLTLNPNKGNGKIRTIRLIKGGAVNAMALPNPGLYWWCKKYGPGIARLKTQLIVSLHAKSPEELGLMAKIIRQFDLTAIEINISCPNIPSPDDYNPSQIIDACKKARASCALPILLKLSAAHEPYLDKFLPHLENTVEAININTVPWSTVFPDKISPLQKFGGGGVSGQPAQKFNWPFMKKLINMTSIPIIAPSIWEFKDIAEVRALGAKAIALGSLFFRPWRPAKFIKLDAARSQN